ncbi:abnormal spindle-like microcephaly-associated protein homolog [Pocillopora verrucosa]|uniref:abnormal spindle-like microcephaly-associated protein homolog n=1 Tax=Pocillopora verrucosa TaxID=203993 RepID=UPI00333E4637
MVVVIVTLTFPFLSFEEEARKKDGEQKRQKAESSGLNECAFIIQRAWRRLISKRLEFQNKCAFIIQRAWRRLKLKRLEFQNECASIIQRAWRRLKLRRLEFQNKAVKLIQRAWRKHRRTRRNECASIIQRAWRRLKLKRLELQNECASIIQRAWRRLKRLEFQEIQVESEIFHSMYTGLQLYNSSNVLMVTSSHYNYNENK